MNDRPFDQIADAFMAAGPVVLPDRVLDAAFEEVHLTRQRRALWRAPWRFPLMNTYAKLAVAAVAVIAVGVLGLTFLGPQGGGVGGAPSAAPSATPVATPSPTVAPSADAGTPSLTGAFTSPTHGYSINMPEGWTTRPATAPWTTEYVDYFSESADLLLAEEGAGFLALASQPLGDRTPEEWLADAWQIEIDAEPGNAGCPRTAQPVTIDGAAGVHGCDLVLVTAGGRGYWIRDFLGDDPPWDDTYDRFFLDSMLASMKLLPEDAVDTAAATVPPLTGQFTSPTHGYAINYPEGWTTRPATTAWTSAIVDYFNTGSDLLMPGDPGSPFLALASQPLGDRTREQFEAEYWQIMVDDDPGTAACAAAAAPITIDGAAGVVGCNTALVTDSGRGYVVMLWSSDGAPYDEAWFASVLATMTLAPEDAVDAGT